MDRPVDWPRPGRSILLARCPYSRMAVARLTRPMTLSVSAVTADVAGICRLPSSGGRHLQRPRASPSTLLGSLR